MHKERADADGNITVVAEQGEQEQIRLFKIRLQRINALRKEQKLPELTAEEYLTLCRPKEITDETAALLSRQKVTVLFFVDVFKAGVSLVCKIFLNFSAKGAGF